MLGATQLAAASGQYLPGVVFPPRLHPDSAAMLPYTHAGAAAAAAAAAFCGSAVGQATFCVSPTYCIGQAMTPLQGDLLAKYLEYIKQRADAAFRYAAAHPASFLANFAPEKVGNVAAEPPPADFVVVQNGTSPGCRAGVLCAGVFLRPGDVYGPMPQQRPAERDKQQHPLDVVFARTNVTPEHDVNAWMLSARTTTKAEEANMSVLRRGDGVVYYRTTRAVWRGEEIVVFVDDDGAAPAGGCSSAADDRLEVKKDDGFQCDRCGKMFAYKYYRDKHLKYTRCVDKGDRKFPCNLCDRSFEKRDRLRIHVLHVHEKHRPHQCAACGKRFSQSSSLNKHTRVHSGERPYKCMYCTKAFTASSILRTHIRQHSGEKPFKCKHCGKAFASHAAHDSHVRRTHKDASSLTTKALANLGDESAARQGSFFHNQDDDESGGRAALCSGGGAQARQQQFQQREEDIDVVQ